MRILASDICVPPSARSDIRTSIRKYSNKSVLKLLVSEQRKQGSSEFCHLPFGLTAGSARVRIEQRA